ncbi:MAG: relaxase/mobilization nuclease domain-containing protein [Ruminiclostridium sp.]|nr:relaxase/mobilization nuclease domain-containing protein [Ruminiclostridium sp.]
MLFADSMNCFTDAHLAYMNMKQVFEHYSTHKFNEPLPEKGNGTVKALHIIQSFSPEDKVSPEQVHKIGMELVRRLYGDKAQAVITTHLDKAHLHNHICVNAYTTDGVKLNNKLSEILRARDLSDDICIERGIMPIMLKFNLEKGDNYSYAEWKHRKQNTSWKARIGEYIDSLIPLAKDLDGLLKIMEAHGYKVKRGMYVSVLAPGQKRAVRLHKLGLGYSEEEIESRILKCLADKPRELTLSEIFRQITREFAMETRNICFAAGVKDTLDLMKKQTALLNTEHITGIGQARELHEQAQKKITELETAITDLSAEIQHRQIVAAAAERFFGKVKPYSASQKKADKLILKNAGVSALADVTGYSETVEADNARLTEMQTGLAEMKQREAVLRSIITTYGDRDDYITKLVKRTREMLSEQEQEKVKRLQSKKITVYQPVTGREIPREQANIDDYAVKHECCVYDLKANPDDMQEILSNLYLSHRLNDADVIRVGDDESVYYSSNGKFWCIADFMQSRAAAERQRQEELEREERERIAEEERRRKQEEQERKKAEEKQKEKKTQQKKKNKTI